MKYKTGRWNEKAFINKYNNGTVFRIIIIPNQCSTLGFLLRREIKRAITRILIVTAAAAPKEFENRIELAISIFLSIYLAKCFT